MSNNDTLTYYYNVNGQIVSETDSSGKERSYSYDPLGRLYREDDAKTGRTTTYTYDNRGNLTQKKVYAYTTGLLASETPQDTVNYGYGNAVWKDLLTAYDGESITYDGVGNPLTYRGGMTFSWQAGRQMKTATVGNLTYTMRYNQDGIRTSKVQSAGSTTGEETVYYIEDGEILGEYRYNAGVKKLLYQFDANGRRIGFTYNGTQYYYRHNLQGDVIAIADHNADTVAKYTYDPWGKVLSVTNAAGVAQASSSFIGNINPIRYRGYYYDTDLGLYYLQSRYYDPETGRFVNGDGYVQTGDGLLDKNMFAYCLDDPMNMADPSGRSCHAMDSGGYGPLCFFANGRCVTHGTVDCCGLGALSSSGIDWNKFKNSDGSYSLYDNRRHSPNNVFHEQLLSVNPSASANLRGGCLGAGISGCIISGAWEWESVRLNLLNFGAYDAYVGRAPKYIGLGAGVSAWSPEITVNIIGWDVTLGADVGAIGAQLGVKSGQFSAGLQYGAGFHFSVGRSNLEMQY